MALLKNQRWELFAQGIAADNLKPLDAYRAAGYEPKTKHSAEAMSSRLLKNVEIQARIAELNGRKAVGIVLTKQRVIEMMFEDRDLARELGQASAAIRANELLAREVGAFIEKKEIGNPGDFDNLSEDELHRRLAALRSRMQDRGSKDQDGSAPQIDQSGLCGEPSSVH